uniref:Uncharacterized protein n=1 Tax=viral metagenome TaxID=1070528 RepID=A0A6C0ARU8_9ZZZZ
MLSQSDKESILVDFPNIKLSYENIVYKKVSQSDNIIAIPEGVKCFAWFTTFKEKNVCLIMELSGNKQICDIKITNACFSNEIAYGTIIYGTVFYHEFNRFFSIEDIFFYKGNDISRENWGNKLIKIHKMFKNDLNQISYNKYYIVFGLPLIAQTNNELQEVLKNIKYKIDTIQFRLYNKSNSFLLMKYSEYLNEKIYDKKEPIKKSELIQKVEPIKKTEPIFKNVEQNRNQKESIFLIRPDIQDDIYYLYSLNSHRKEEQVGIAHIPDFKTSSMMNKLFRIIKENNNLDALEESDDEEEFENDKVDKFVKLDTSHKMVCQYNYKFKKWLPIRLYL